MIKTEYFKTRKDGVKLYRNYSTDSFYIVQNETGFEYIEAIDIENSPYTYLETDKPINNTEEATEQDYINALAEFGVIENEENNIE